MTTYTEKIFQLSAPYDNPYQGNEPRWVFVCSAGILRSASAARIAGQFGINARACGSSDYALIPLSVNLIEWAHKIVFMMDDNKYNALRTFEPLDGYYVEQINRKSIVWGIPDLYEYMSDPLVHAIIEKLHETRPVTTPAVV